MLAFIFTMIFGMCVGVAAAVFGMIILVGEENKK